MEDTYYFITVFKEYNEYGPRMMRCWGFYKDFSEAMATVRHNVTDLWETIYEYAIIEEYHEGIGGYNFNRWFFRYNQFTNEYVPIDEPEGLKHYAGFAIG